MHSKAWMALVEDVQEAIMDFDKYYVQFEQNYIEALIAVEKRSRSLVQEIAEMINRGLENGIIYDVSKIYVPRSSKNRGYSWKSAVPWVPDIVLIASLGSSQILIGQTS